MDAWPDEPETDPETFVTDPDLYPYEITQDERFHIGPDDDPIDKIYRCKKCGGTQFVVGTGYYFTAIKCPTCGWERCVHSG